MKKYGPFLFLILMLAVQPTLSSGNLEDSGMQAALFNSIKIKPDPIESQYLEPRSSAVIARIFVPDI